MKSISTIVKGDGLAFTFSGCADDPITKHHLKTGSFYEHAPMGRLAHLVRKITIASNDGYVIDAGANIGNHTLYFAGMCSYLGVHSFEMNPVTFDYLKSNVELSGLKNISILNNGLSSKNGKCGIKQNSDNPLGGAQLDFSERNTSEVELITLDDWAAKEHLNKRCVLIKMDVEGHEYEVLKGAKKLINDNFPMIYAELKEVQQFKMISEFLFGMGYVIAYAEEGALPNFLFVRRREMNSLFSVIEIDEIRNDLCSRVVDTWQLHRKIKNLMSG